MSQRWFYLGEKGAQGPQTTEEILKLLEVGGLGGDTMLKPEEGKEWRSIRDYAEFKIHFPPEIPKELLPDTGPTLPKRKWQTRWGWLRSVFWVALFGAAIAAGFYINDKFAQFPKVPDLSLGEYEILREAATRNKALGPSIGVVLVPSAKDTPVIYVSSNEMDLTEYEVKLESEPGTLILARSASAKARAEIKKHIWRSFPLKMSNGLPLPVGRYRVEVRYFDKKEDAPLYTTSLLFLGNLPKDKYEDLLKAHVEEKESGGSDGGNERALSEMSELSDIIKGLKESVISAKKIFSQTKPNEIEKSQAAWKAHASKWSVRDAALAKRFNTFKATQEFDKSKFVFKRINRDLYEIWKKVQSYHRRQDNFFRGRVPEEEVSTVRLGVIEDTSVVVREVEMVEAELARESMKWVH